VRAQSVKGSDRISPVADGLVVFSSLSTGKPIFSCTSDVFALLYHLMNAVSQGSISLPIGGVTRTKQSTSAYQGSPPGNLAGVDHPMMHVQVDLRVTIMMVI
jgi:hypothetical protein